MGWAMSQFTDFTSTIRLTQNSVKLASTKDVFKVRRLAGASLLSLIKLDKLEDLVIDLRFDQFYFIANSSMINSG
ncbi:hypothetical protein FOPG_20068 [Fusarium oxysporum f. sp. conglutinans race 2 54008]|uniref:Uncharacterized protein n=1 Tax=Fusarium oxysporum f. sp. conglutinans race 2 54008 TaxID=1089457 RepID=X0HR08_FUSOX|nr:hypothetical protein FOPG_20068 [Fusarium oxysporum f. sp. conglutinans race 2 54008]